MSVVLIIKFSSTIMQGKMYLGWLVGCRVYGRLSHEGPRPMGGMPSVGVFLRDPCPTLKALFPHFREKEATT